MNTTILFEVYLATVSLSSETVYIKIIDTLAYNCYEYQLTRDDPDIIYGLYDDISSLQLFYIIENSFNKEPGYMLSIKINNNIMNLFFNGYGGGRFYTINKNIQKISYPIVYMSQEITKYHMDDLRKIVSGLSKITSDIHTPCLGVYYEPKKIKIE